ncbi:serine hydrolase domain-containing protein [Alteromonas oceanisediminis]|uniref:serine hydrolase domain-containing protein n=1 Tax=Alteromonas oceanisediminis TaxID=2836180 RepID=UPI001BDADC32|nr:serine hydrolase domain-containing protein [Alteromonas oceanisediminis]MBT0586170.1 beta-lactamase family protein [Alteromonas oceanisediminis]
MNRMLIVTTIAVLALGISVARAELSPPDELSKQIPELMQHAKVKGLAIAKVNEGTITWHAAFGARSPDDPMQVDTVFNAASLTKPVFAMMSLHLVANDTLTLDGALSDYWIDPDVVNDPRHQALTARIILSHQSGLPNWRGERQLAFLFAPGARHEYSGEGYEYLRHAIENNTQAPLPSLVHKHVFAPAGMTHSAMSWAESMGNNVALGFDESGNTIDSALTEKQPNAAAHLMTTVDDYARFLSWVAQGAGLPDPIFQQMQQPQALHDDPAERFGLGWKLIPLTNTELLMHDGREPGVRTYAVVHPETQEGLVILTNSSNGDLIFRDLIVAALSYGDELMQSTDQLVWDYLQHLPSQALIPMSQGIAQSPAYLSTLLHAVNTVLVQTSPLTTDEKFAAAQAIKPFVLGRLNNTVSAEQAKKLIHQLFVTKQDAVNIATSMDVEQARKWLRVLENI